jgi:hypothetical protein
MWVASRPKSVDFSLKLAGGIATITRLGDWPGQTDRILTQGGCVLSCSGSPGCIGRARNPPGVRLSMYADRLASRLIGTTMIAERPFARFGIDTLHDLCMRVQEKA